MKVIIYHNEKCAKSNAALGLLVKQDVEVSIVFGTAKTLLAKPGIEASGFIRVGELSAKEPGTGFNDIRDDDQWLAFMIQHPILIERPTVVVNNKAVIVRRLQQVLQLGRQSVGPCYDA